MKNLAVNIPQIKTLDPDTAFDIVKRAASVDMEYCRSLDSSVRDALQERYSESSFYKAHMNEIEEAKRALEEEAKRALEEATKKKPKKDFRIRRLF